MNAYLRKEIRLLLPSFVAALVLSFSIWLVPLDNGSNSNWRPVLFIFPFLLCPAMLVMMAVASFGREISSGTFANLLEQPISRPRIWATKTALLAGAIGIVACSSWLCSFFYAPSNSTDGETQGLSFRVPLLAFAVFASGPWTVLLFRQMAAAFWVTLIVPGALAMAVAGLTTNRPERTEPMMLVVLSIYILAGVQLSRWLFLRAQDVSWTGGNIVMPEVRGLRGWFAERMSHRCRRPRAALFAKEFQLHQSLLVIAGVLALAHLAFIVMRPAAGGFHTSSTMGSLDFVANAFWVLWPVMMPLLIGCAAVAEERKLGTLEAQLCLPVRRRTQFAIKFTVALVLVILLGVLVPFFLEGKRILPDFGGTNFDRKFSPELLGFYAAMAHGNLVVAVLKAIEALNPLLPFLPMLLVATSLLVVSFYASTLVRNTLQAFAPAVLGTLLAWGLLVGAVWIGDASHLWRGWLIYLLGVPALTLTLAGLMYWNFKRVLVGWPVWRRNLFTFLTVLASVAALTSLIYNRVWEFLTPEKPASGPPRLTQAQAAMMRSLGTGLVLPLPDGRIRIDHYKLAAPTLGAMLTRDWKVTELFPGGRFLEGSNWTSVAFFSWDVAAIQRDGSLWTLQPRTDPSRQGPQQTGSNSASLKMLRLGADRNWKSVAGRLALKTDGTLWRLGGGRISLETRTNWPGFRAFEPKRLGNDSDWAELGLVSWPSPVVLRKTDGRAWIGHVNSYNRKAEVLDLDEETSFTRSKIHDGQGWRGMTWAQSDDLGNSFQVGVRQDGTFRVCSGYRHRPPTGGRSGSWELTEFDLQLGKESDWRAVAGGSVGVVTLKTDGSLWRWNFPVDPVQRPDAARATRLGAQSDWVAAVSTQNGITSLAADGSLWLWRIGFRESAPSEPAIQPLLAASRKPQFLGNVFGKSE